MHMSISNDSFQLSPFGRFFPTPDRPITKAIHYTIQVKLVMRPAREVLFLQHFVQPGCSRLETGLVNA